jgi:hypothetical protein
MSNVAIHLTIEPGSGRPVSLARVSDPAILRQVARAAIHAAHQKAAEDFFRDMTLGQIRSEDATRLERYLEKLIPGLQVG